MRPVAKRQSTLRYPLNSILGAEANVRVLRALSLSTSARSYSDLTRETGLSVTGLRRSVAALEEAGLTDVLGASAKRVRLRREYPLANELVRLFRAEAEAWSGLMDELRAVFENLRRTPISAWVAPDVAGTDEVARRLLVCILANSDDVNAIELAAEPAIAKLETSQDLMIELRPLTRADLRSLPQLERERLVRGTPVFGPDPSALLEDTRIPKVRAAKPPHTHAEHDVRSLALAKKIAEAILRDPSLIERARTLVMKRLERASPSEQRELREWQRVLRSSPYKIRRLLVDPGERATRLRQTLPFVDALPREERDATLTSLASDQTDET